MLTKDFYFDLPTELIAQHPSGIRGQDKLMVLEKSSGKVFHYMMNELPALIPQDALMIFNDSKVRHSRVYGIKESTGRECEFLFIQPLAENKWKAVVKNAKKQRPGCKYKFPDGSTATIINNQADEGTEFRSLQFDRNIDEIWFEVNGHIPLPPYIRREDTSEDKTRYQNVYAKETGSAACPTAGLHFTEEMLATLENKGIERAWVTLHVGLGTFLPVRTEQIQNHKMHFENYSISKETADLVTKAKKMGRPILAVGTTSVRTLESAWDSTKNCLTEGIGNTNIFIYPGYSFKIVDKLFTNFHTPESTLLMLVSAFAGKENIMEAYNQAIKKRYRFFSYGDAMLIL